jgi:nitrite reductase/ring-hydroxylating ferredoxin subunit
MSLIKVRARSSVNAAASVDGSPADVLLRSGRTLSRLGDTEVLVVRTRRGVFAVENRCPHLGRRLADARVSGRTLVCPGHQRRYDLASGGLLGRQLTPTAPLRTFAVEIADGQLRISPMRAAAHDYEVPRG